MQRIRTNSNPAVKRLGGSEVGPQYNEDVVLHRDDAGKKLTINSNCHGEETAQ
jgi:hypothetical protein